MEIIIGILIFIIMGIIISKIARIMGRDIFKISEIFNRLKRKK